MIRYFWSESNGTNRPTVRYMDFEPSTEYYNGMPLKKNEAGAVMPTTGEPEYICMWDYQPDGDIRTLEIPVIEVFPDTIYEKWNEDGTVEEVRFGGGTGGGDVLNENGKLRNDVLPDGYPYEKTTTFESQTYDYTPVEKSSGNPCHSDSYDGDSQILRLGNDDLQEGQLIRVNYDGVNYDCVVRYAHFNWWIGNPTLTKNSSENGNMDDGIDYIEKSEHYVDSGEPFCYIVHNYYNTRYALFTLDTKPRTVTFTPIEKEIIPIAKKFLPDGYPYDAGGFSYTNSGYQGGEELINNIYFKVSDDTPSYEDLLGAKLNAFDGEVICSKENLMYREGECCVISESAVVVYKDNLSMGNFVFPTAGIYMFIPAVGSITLSENGITTLAQKFLPKITIVQDGYADAAAGVSAAGAATYTCTANVTFEELLQALQNKNVPMVELYYHGHGDGVIGVAKGGTTYLRVDIDGNIQIAQEFYINGGYLLVVWEANGEIRLIPQ